MLFIGICGASGSGKSTLAKELVRDIGARAVVLNQDAYYRDHPDLSFEERTGLNYDEPCIFDHDLLYQDVTDLLAGKSVTRKAYDFSLHRRNDTQEIIQPADVLIVEGIHAFFDPRLREMMDMKVYIQVDSDVCLLRRIKRDIRDRGRDVPSITAQYLATVKPMLDKYIRAYVQHADIILPGGGKNPLFLDMLCLYIDAHVPAANAQ